MSFFSALAKKLASPKQVSTSATHVSSTQTNTLKDQNPQIAKPREKSSNRSFFSSLKLPHFFGRSCRSSKQAPAEKTTDTSKVNQATQQTTPRSQTGFESLRDDDLVKKEMELDQASKAQTTDTSKQLQNIQIEKTSRKEQAQTELKTNFTALTQVLSKQPIEVTKVLQNTQKIMQHINRLNLLSIDVTKPATGGDDQGNFLIKCIDEQLQAMSEKDKNAMIKSMTKGDTLGEIRFAMQENAVAYLEKNEDDPQGYTKRMGISTFLTQFLISCKTKDQESNSNDTQLDKLINHESASPKVQAGVTKFS